MRSVIGLAVSMIAIFSVLPMRGLPPVAAAFEQQTHEETRAARLVTSPACPTYSIDPVSHETSTEPITVEYTTKAKGSLQSVKSLTLHVALPGVSQPGTVQSFSMTLQPGGRWLATITLKGRNTGYLLFDVEDQDHHVDQNGGQYWDSELCFANPNTPTKRQSSVYGFRSKLSSYDGGNLAPGFQRPPDTARALAIVREHFTAYPQDFSSLFWIWTYETKGGLGRGSDADWAQVSRELDAAIAKDGTTYGFFSQVMGFIGPNEARIDPAVIQRLRAAIIASPQTIQPMVYQPDGSQRPIPHGKRWDDAMTKNVAFWLSELDLPVAEHVADPAARGAALEAFTKKYEDCGTMCHELAPAYAYGVRAYVEAGDLESAKRLEEDWTAWDPNNPDPPATLAKAYLDAGKQYSEALALTNRAEEQYRPFATVLTKLSSDHTVRSDTYFEVSPYASSRGKLELLRGKIEVAMGDWKAAANDLQVASDALGTSGQTFYATEATLALGNAQEHLGNADAALGAYLRAASGPYQKDAVAHDHYVHLFVFTHKGSEQQAEDSLLAAVQHGRSKLAGSYTPVKLHQPLPKLQLTGLNGKPVRIDASRHPIVVDLWATWCGACEVEMPALLAFQRAHPEVEVVAVDIADSPEAVTTFLTKKGMTDLHVALTPAFPEGMAQNYPTTFVVSPKNEIVFLHEGVPDDLAAELGADLAALKLQ